MTHHESKLTLDIIDKLMRERDIWKSRADAHEQDYLAMLKRIDKITADRDIWKDRAINKSTRDTAIAIDEYYKASKQCDRIANAAKVAKKYMHHKLNCNARIDNFPCMCGMEEASKILKSALSTVKGGDA